MDSAGDIIDAIGRLLGGLGALLWPVLVIVALLLFRGQLADLIGRIYHLKGPGFEADIDRRLSNLRNVVETEERTGAEPSPVSPPPPPPPSPQYGDSVDPAREAIKAAADSARAGLMLVSADMEQAMRRILASVGHEPDRPSSIRHMASELERAVGLPEHVADALREFADIRNRIVHGHPDITEAETLRAVDVGVSLLYLLYNHPYERHKVALPGVPVLQDPDGQLPPAAGVTAVLLEAEDVDGSVLWTRPFPTRTTTYEPGQYVSWEWDTDTSYGPAWYRDPLTDQIVEAWTSSLLFRGRPLDQI